MKGIIIAAPSSGCGKTTVTLALLRHLSRKGIPVRGAKSGPDYIDPGYHAVACGKTCYNLDAWAMSPARMASLATGDDFLIIEGAMGLFDGARPDGHGSVADIARMFNLPVILVVDAGRMAGSVAPLVAGFANHDRRVVISGVILNNIGSERHAETLKAALAPCGLPVLASVPRNPQLLRRSRHLGLELADEQEDLDTFLNAAAHELGKTLEASRFLSMAQPLPTRRKFFPIAPPAQRIAVAQDRAFAFIYPHLLDDWRSAGAEIQFFSPLADEPVPEADFIFLPGGYPELYAGQLAAAETFINSLRKSSHASVIYGECGGYMTLGNGLTDAQGIRHRMAGLLDLETTFHHRRLHLGYRHLVAREGPFTGSFTGHEFHYASTISSKGTPLFQASDSGRKPVADMGLRKERVSGSFAHLIDRVA